MNSDTIGFGEEIKKVIVKKDFDFACLTDSQPLSFNYQYQLGVFRRNIYDIDAKIPTLGDRVSYSVGSVADNGDYELVHKQVVSHGPKIEIYYQVVQPY